MKNFLEYIITIFLVALAVIVSVNLMKRAVDKKEIANCEQHVKKAQEYTEYFITQPDKEACDYYHIDVSSVRVIETK